MKRLLIAFALLLACFILPYSAIATTYTYDSMHRLTSVTYSNGQKVTYTYDAAGNILSVTKSALLKVAATATKSSVSMAAGDTAVSATDNTWVLGITAGTLKDSVSMADLEITGLPSGLACSAGKATDSNSIVITVSGTADPAVTQAATVNIVVRGSGVQEAGAADSAPVSVQVSPASQATPVLTALTLSGSPNLTYEGQPFTYDLAGLTLTGADQFGNLYDITGQTVTWAIATGSPATLGSDGHTLTITGSGAVAVTATISQIASDSLTLNVTQATPVLTALTLSGNPGLTYEGQPFTYDLTGLTLTGADQFGSAYDITGQTVAWAVVSGNATVSGTTLEISSDGSVVVTAGIGSITSNSLAINVTKATPVLTTLNLSGNPPLTYKGTPFTYDLSGLTLTGADQFGSAYDITGQTVAWAVVSGNATVSGGTLTINSAGQVDVTATIGTVTSNALSLSVGQQPQPPSSDATLSDLTVSAGTLTPAFDSKRTSYTDTLAYGATGISVTPTVHESHATVTVNGVSVISGQPSPAISLSVGSNTVKIVITAQNGATTKTYTLTVKVKPPVIKLSPGYLPACPAEKPYSTTFTASGGTGPYTFTESGALPDGISFSVDTISGTTLTTGSYPITITATDAGGFTGTRKYTLTVKAPVIKLSPGYLTACTAERPYSMTFTASGGTGPYTFTASGALPPGLTFSTDTISGTTTATGSYPITVTATDASGFTGARKYTLTVKARSIKLGSLPAVTAEKPYSRVITASGGIGPYVFSLTSGALPGGLALTPDGTLSGTTTATGSYPVTVTAADANGFTGARSYTLIVKAPTITVRPVTLHAATLGKAYKVTFSASGGVAPYIYSESGSLPTGLVFNNNILSGIPTTAGSFPFTVTATDAGGFTGTMNYTLTL